MAARYMLDTDIFSYIINNRYPQLRDKFSKLSDSICISAITYAEARYGARKKGSAKLDSLIEMLAELIEIVPWTATEADEYATIRDDLEKRGVPIGANDTLIAASAKAHGSILVTNNEEHFVRVQGLLIENWVTADS